MAFVQLVKGATYACGPVFGKTDVLRHGDRREVSDAHLALLLKDTYLDRANNEHPYFKEVDSLEAPEGGEDGEGRQKKATRQTRTPRK